MPVDTSQEAEAWRNQRASETVELGPKSRALLRRFILALEVLYDMQIPDPGETFETEAAQYDAPYTGA